MKTDFFWVGFVAARALDGVVAKCLDTGFLSTQSETGIKELGSPNRENGNLHVQRASRNKPHLKKICVHL